MGGISDVAARAAGFLTHRDVAGQETRGRSVVWPHEAVTMTGSRYPWVLPLAAVALFFVPAAYLMQTKGAREQTGGIDLGDLGKDESTGALFGDDDFKALCKRTVFHAIVRGQDICVVDPTSLPASRSHALRVAVTSRIACATIAFGKIVYVERSGTGQELKAVSKEGKAGVIYSTRPDRPNGEARFIHSLSRSHSGRLLAFMVSRTNRWGDWRGQQLLVYDSDADQVRAVWRGDIQGPSSMIDPYKWVQPLPWSLEDEEVLVSTPSKAVLAINAKDGTSRKICEGGLPVGFLTGDTVLTLDQAGRIKWVVTKHDLKRGVATVCLRMDGVAEVRAPVLSPDRRYLSCVAAVVPEDFAPYSLYTLIVRLEDGKFARVDAEIVALSGVEDKAGTVPSRSATSTSTHPLP
jgi:hypothetical protein